jgi:hypothetical protein
MTALIAGPADQISTEQIRQMAAAAGRSLADVPPVTIKFGKILYHAQAIMLAAQPAGPIISALGQSLPERRAQINSVSLVNQIGSEGNWNWHPEATIRLGATELYSALVAPGRMPARCGLSLVDVGRGNSTSE